MSDVVKVLLIVIEGVGRALGHVVDADGDLDAAIKASRQDELDNRKRNDARLRKPRG